MKSISTGNGIEPAQFAGFGVFRNGIYEEAMGGFDVEVGMLLPISNSVETRAYLAGYHFKGEDVAPSANGIRARVEARVNQNLAFGASTQHDKVFGTANFVEVRYTFGKTSKPSIRTLRERMAEPWTRDIDVVVSKPTESTDFADAVRTPDSAVHVNNTAVAGGDGSYEHPYDSVAACEAAKCMEANTAGVGDYNLIRLWQGNSSPETPYTSFTGLRDGQTLWGQGIDFYTGRAQPALYPVIDSSGGAGVTLYSGGSLGNTVKGVKIVGTGRGIVGNNTWGTVNIQGNDVQVSGNGIALNNSISDATSRVQNVTIANNTIASSVSGEGAGIAISNSVYGESGVLTQTAMISNNSINGSSAYYGVAIGVANYASYGGAIDQTATISGNTIAVAEGGAGIVLNTDAQYENATITQTATISGNTLSGGSGSGVNIDNYADDTGITRQNITISGNTINVDDVGVAIGSDGDEGADRAQTVTISGNTITSANAYGIVILNEAGGSGDPTTSTQSLAITGNTITAAYGSGIGIDIENLAKYDGSIATQTATISGNTIVAGHIGIYTSNDAQADYSSNTATQNLTISGNTINAGAYGIALKNQASSSKYMADTASQTATLSGNTLNTENGLVGMYFNNWDDGYHNAVQIVTVSGDNKATGFAIGIHADNNTDVAASAQTVDVSGATITSTQENAVGVGKCNWVGNQAVTLGSGVTLNGASQTAATNICIDR